MAKAPRPSWDPTENTMDEKNFRVLAEELDVATIRNILLQVNHFVPDSASVAFEYLEQRAAILSGTDTKRQSLLTRSFSLDDLATVDGQGPRAASTDLPNSSNSQIPLRPSVARALVGSPTSILGDKKLLKELEKERKKALKEQAKAEKIKEKEEKKKEKLLQKEEKIRSKQSKKS